MAKYIFENGVMKLDPTYKAQQAAQGQKPLGTDNHPQALAIISTTQDIQDATKAQSDALGHPMRVSEATAASMEIMQDPEYLQRFKTKQELDGGDLIDGLSAIFAKYEVPIGLVNKLLALSEYKLNFIIDDSTSMGNFSDLPISQASEQVRAARDPQGRRTTSRNDKITRWEEAEDRLHVMIDMLAYIPIDNIVISFLNRDKKIALSHTGKTPEQFAQEAHAKITEEFSRVASGSTPLKRNLSNAFNQAIGNTMHYLFTDGEPSDASIEDVADLILKRRNPQANPLTLISCTNDDAAVEWMKDVEEKASFTSELDDFISERKEVLKDQGVAFPFTRGFWLICQLVASINPYDLDAMDESVPFTKKTLDDLMGRTTTIEEYRHYFQNNPHMNKYRHLQQQFEREDILAHHILKPTAQQPVYQQQPAQYAASSSQQPFGAQYPAAPAYNAYSGTFFQQQPAPAPRQQPGTQYGTPAFFQQQPAPAPQQQPGSQYGAPPPYSLN